VRDVYLFHWVADGEDVPQLLPIVAADLPIKFEGNDLDLKNYLMARIADFKFAAWAVMPEGMTPTEDDMRYPVYNPDYGMKFKTHTKNLLEEVTNCPGTSVLRIPLNILYSTLRDVAAHVNRVGDPELQALMCQLTMYSVADPEHPDYDQEQLDEVYKLASAAKNRRKLQKQSDEAKS